MSERITQEKFISKLKKKYGDKFDYSEFIYTNNKTKSKLKCNLCGAVLYVRPNDLFNKVNYHNCASKTKRMTLEEFIKKANYIHNNFFTYDNLIYNGVNKKGIVSCPIHGDFEVRLCNHLSGYNCPTCSKLGIKHEINKCNKVNKSTKKLSQNDFITKINTIFGSNRYDLSKLEYINYRTPVILICHETDEFGNEHGEFSITPSHLLNGQGCSKCARNYHPTNDEFIKILKIKRNDANISFEKVKYKSIHEPIILTCHEKYPNGEEHGDFLMLPSNFIHNKQNCPKCSIYKMEQDISILLTQNKIQFIEQCGNKILPWIGNYKLDFYLPDYNIAIECQGEQHFRAVEWFGGAESFKNTVERDRIKNNLCKNHDINLLYYSTVDKNIQTYYCFNDKEILLNEIKKHKLNR